MKAKSFSLKKKFGKWYLSYLDNVYVDETSNQRDTMRNYQSYNTWEEAMEKVNELMQSWKNQSED